MTEGPEGDGEGCDRASITATRLSGEGPAKMARSVDFAASPEARGSDTNHDKHGDTNAAIDLRTDPRPVTPCLRSIGHGMVGAGSVAIPHVRTHALWRVRCDVSAHD